MPTPKYCPQCATALTPQTIDQQMRLACPASACQFVHWDNPIPVVAAIVEHNRQYLLARNSQWPAGKFSMITGFLETGEDPQQGIIREVAEELGLQTQQATFVGHFPFPRFNQLLIAYFVQAQGEIRLNEELAEIQCLSREELAAYDFGRMQTTADIVAHVLQINT